MKTYIVALWETRLSAKPTYEITSIKETPQEAAIDAMKAAQWFSWGVVVVMNEQEQVSFFDAEWHNGKFTYSKTEAFPRLAYHPFVTPSQKPQA